MQPICLFFIIDGLKLEAQACLLIPTIRKFYGDSVHVIAYRREDVVEPLQPVTQQILETGKVEVRLIPGTSKDDKSPWVEPYPIGNKIMAASDRRDCEISVFIDTDTVFVDHIDFAKLLGDGKIGAAASDYSFDANKEDAWTQFYALYDLPLPKERVRLLGGRRLLSFPYFNAGMIAFREDLGDGLHFGEEWLKDAIKFDHEMDYEYDRTFTDQITLPITAYRLKNPVKPLNNFCNYNLQSYGTTDAPQALVHYHNFGVLWIHEAHSKLVLQELRHALGDPELKEFLESFKGVIRRQRLKRIL